MTDRGLLVPRSRGEVVRRALLEAGLLGADRKVRPEGDSLVFPLRPGATVPEGWGEVVERQFLAKPRPRPADYRALLPWPPAEFEHLPRAFDVVGDVVLVRIPPEVAGRAHEIGDALLRFVPGARLVGWDHGVHGADRRRQLERIAGQGEWATRHRENRLVLEVDPERAYFSPRLGREHARVSADVGEGDRVYDLCCGVGPFAVQIARDGRAREVVAVDSNPEAVALLRRTLARYPFGGRVAPFVASIETFLPGRAPFERVILNLPHEGIKYASLVARAVAPGGRLYYYEIVPRGELGRRAEALVDRFEPRGLWKAVETHVVHPYSPGSDLGAFVFARPRG